MKNTSTLFPFIQLTGLCTEFPLSESKPIDLLYILFLSGGKMKECLQPYFIPTH